MEEFFETEGQEDGQFPLPAENRTQFLKTSTGCDKRAKSMFILFIFQNLGSIFMINISPCFCSHSSGEIACDPLFEFLEKSADLMPQFNSSTCIIFDEDKFNGDQMPQESLDKVKSFCDPREVCVL